MSESISMKKIVLRTMLLVVLSIFVFAAYLVYWLYSYSEQPGPMVNNKEKVRVYIPKGASFRDIEIILINTGLIEDDPRFALVAKLSKLSHRMQAGEFMIKTGQKPENLLKSIATAKSIQHKITVPEGLNYKEIAKIVCAKDICEESEFIKLATDKNFVADLGIKAETLEGYLYPDTYHLSYKELNAKSIVKRMVGQFQKNWQHSLANRSERTKGLSMHKIVTMASLVEEEAVKVSEQPVIAGVFYNRLDKGIRLQSDPTSIYGREHKGPITGADVRHVNPYNTYVIAGLPPGPISNPGVGAIKAALNPERNKLYYFVSNNDGSHSFSKNLREHNRAVNRYRKILRKARQAKKIAELQEK
ncbi:MAG: endolytic transglycosylase MltG [Desulfotalea sp.]